MIIQINVMPSGLGWISRDSLYYEVLVIPCI
jgi:hypothetical protein